jgi:hypothetical protein
MQYHPRFKFPNLFHQCIRENREKQLIMNKNNMENMQALVSYPKIIDDTNAARRINRFEQHCKCYMISI